MTRKEITEWVQTVASPETMKPMNGRPPIPSDRWYISLKTNGKASNYAELAHNSENLAQPSFHINLPKDRRPNLENDRGNQNAAQQNLQNRKTRTDQANVQVAEEHRGLSYQDKRSDQTVIRNLPAAQRCLIYFALALQVWVSGQLAKAACMLQQDIGSQGLREKKRQEHDWEPRDPHELVDGPMPSIGLSCESTLYGKRGGINGMFWIL